MKKLVFLFVGFIFLFCGLASAGEISVNYPAEVESAEEFSFEIELIGFEEGIYDVKIDILADGDRISKILNDGKWKSTFNYLKQVIEFGEKEEFTLKTEGYIGDADIEVKIRNVNEKVEIFLGYKIKVTEGTSLDEEEDEETEEEETNEKTEIEDEEKFVEEKVDKEKENVEEDVNENVAPQVIRLNAQTIKSQENNEKQGKNIYAILGLGGFCLLLGVLFFFRHRRYKTEFD